MSIFTANMRSMYFNILSYCSITNFLCYSYLIRMKDFERERRLEERAAKNENH
jgi:hypothetical protein